jgi:hypothetical protein
VIQWDCNEVDTVVRPASALIHIRRSLHVAVGEVDLDIEVIFSATQIVVPGGDPQIEQAHCARTAGKQCWRLGADRDSAILRLPIGLGSNENAADHGQYGECWSLMFSCCCFHMPLRRGALLRLHVLKYRGKKLRSKELEVKRK